MSATIKDYTPEILKDLQKKQLTFVQKAAQAVRTEAVLRVPVITGNLKNSIQVASFVDDGEAVAEVGATAEYAPKVEYGTDRQASKPFLEPAVKYVQENIIPRLEKDLEL